MTPNYFLSLSWCDLQQNGVSYVIFYCQKGEINSGNQDFTSRDHLFWSRLSPLEGSGPPIINSTGLYRLILVRRCFIKTVPIEIWVITAMIRFCSSVYHEIWEVTAVIIAF